MNSKTIQIALLPGDGIGPEIMAATKPVIEAVGRSADLDFELVEDYVGGAGYDVYGIPLSEQTLKLCKKSDFILLGAVGGPKWSDVAYDKRPEAAILSLRKELGLFANLRPAIVFDALIEASSLKAEIVRGLDILIVRELTGGIYFGEPRGIEQLENGERRGINTQTYTSSEIRRIAEIAFELAGQRTGRVTSTEKSNVMESGMLWREEVSHLHSETIYKSIKLDHMYADNVAMQLLKDPGQFDIILTDNLFGDILSDEAAMITGSIGMLPSASLGAAEPETGRRHALYEPVHGSAPDIAGQGKANPLAMILSFSMALKYSLNMPDLADRLNQAVSDALQDGYRTVDIAGKNKNILSTHEMGCKILDYF
mgnify:CR=1 FL=1